jgi:hypothetical protein
MWILGGIFAIVLAICVAGAVLALSADNPDIDVNLGDDEAEFANVEARAATVARDGPTPIADPLNGSRPLLLQHLAEEPDEGWIAILAVSPDDGSCAVNWDDDAGVFEDCAGQTYPPDGEGLDTFPTRVEDDTLFVDLGRGRQDDQPDDESPDDSIVITGED